MAAMMAAMATVEVVVPTLESVIKVKGTIWPPPVHSTHATCVCCAVVGRGHHVCPCAQHHP
jgi:hypothetical protein